jgi:imidazolonepropionase-like amidohydrolase
MRNPVRPLPLVFALSAASASFAQIGTAPEIEVARAPQSSYALQNANVLVSAGDFRRDVTLVIADGRVKDIIKGRAAPAGSTVIDVRGQTIRPAFIDIAAGIASNAKQLCASKSNLGLQNPAPRMFGRGGGDAAGAAPTTSNGAGHWNKSVCPERSVATDLMFEEDKLKAMRKQGFGYALSHPQGGVFRGSSALVSLSSGATANKNLLASNVTQAIAIEPNYDFSGYPASDMGAVALLRQGLIDARWHAAQKRDNKGERAESNAALDALGPVVAGEQALVMFTKNELEVLRAQKLAAEFDVRIVVVGSGTEYRVQNQIAQKLDVVLPLNFADAPGVDDPEMALDVSLAELEHWRYGAFGPGLLAKRNERIALTTKGLANVDSFLSKLRTAVRYGLDENQAYKALTQSPVAMLGAALPKDVQIGSLTVGSLASFSIADANWLSSDQAVLNEMWIEGQREIFKALDHNELRGTWKFVAGVQGEIDIKGNDAVEWVKADADKKSEGKADDKSANSNGKSGADADKAPTESIGLKVDGERIFFYLSANAAKRVAGANGLSPLTIELQQQDKALVGRWFDSNGVARNVRAEWVKAAADKPTPPAAAVPALPAAWRYPAGEHGRNGMPAQTSVVIRNVTAWITGKDEPEVGIDVWLDNGRIKALGKALQVPNNVSSVDGTGKHISPGLIDTHSHIAAGGNVNEGSHAITSEVRVGDQVDPTDINVYRELAGGTTTSHVLHGSANAIGGQSALIKHRWGGNAEQLMFADSMPTIKFALGENPKQSNWGDGFRTRYPQTRMGVEALLRSQFTAAKSYLQARKANPGTRRDLRLEAIGEILEGKRLVHVHSYRADEILMFARLSQEFGFKIAAFQHVLEGYKVGKEIAEAGAGASTFSDWWAFKVEAIDAIPHNAALMQDQNVLASLNSDSPDLGRRLNTEAAKMMRYGNLTATQALTLVTLNSAKQLRIDNEVGSLEAGKSADVVLWSHSPLSSFAVPEKVWIDGREYFDRAQDRAEQARIASERAALVDLALQDKVKAIAAKPAAPAKDAQFAALDLNGDHDHNGDHEGHQHGPLHWNTSKHWPSQWMRLRGLYHNGETSHFCTDGE